MGKKKSMVLMVIISVILAALTLFTVLPSFAFPWNDGLNGWRSVVAEFVDFGSDYKGGHYAYYYPEGIIPASQYKALSEDEQADYAKLGDGGLYVDKNADIAEGNGVSADFNEEFAKFRDMVSERYRQKGYSDYVVTVVDNYAIRVEVPVSDANYAETLALFAETRKLTMKLNGEVVDELSDEDANIRDYIQEFSLRSQFAYRYIHVRLTKAGADLINGMEEDSSIVSQSSDTTQDGKTGLWLYFDDEPALPIYKENVASDYVLKCAYNEADYESALQTRVILFNSLLNADDYSFVISDVSSEIREKSHAYGEESSGIMLIVLGVMTLAAIALAVVFAKKYGVVFGYMTLTYVSVTGLCFAFISPGVFEFTLGTAFAYVLGLALMYVLHFKHYKAIQNEIALGKTASSAVTLGYKKTLWTTVDVYVALALGAVAILLGIATATAFACQTLICLVAGAFNSLLWGRVINYLFLSATATNDRARCAYFGIKKEEEDDE